jgi:hypothetical protein
MICISNNSQAKASSISDTPNSLQNTSNKSQYQISNNSRKNSRNTIKISAKKNSSNHYNSGKWSTEEHLEFLKGCLVFGKNWNKVSFIILN